jgi:hypothetical protein
VPQGFFSIFPWLRRRRSTSNRANPRSSQHTTLPSIRQDRTLEVVHGLRHQRVRCVQSYVAGKQDLRGSLRGEEDGKSKGKLKRAAKKAGPSRKRVERAP